MSVRARLALTVFATGLVTALLVGAAVAWGYVRLEHETASRRGLAFLDRVGAMYDRVVDLQRQSPPEFERWLRNLVLYEPDTELYLLDLEGRVLARTGAAPLPAGFRVALEPVHASVSRPDMPYVMGDDPERMDRDAVVVARTARASGADGPAGAAVDAGYLYLVIHTKPLSDGRAAALRASFAQPAIGLVLAIIACTTALALLIIGAVTRPLRALTAAVATLSERGLDDGIAPADPAALAALPPVPPLPPVTRDEFGRLTAAFGLLLDVVRRQWRELQRLDRFRREGVSNLSHDLRSPLTAGIACLETLEARDDARPVEGRLPEDERRLLGVALRNTRNAARLVRALGDLAKLDEPSFPVRREPVELGELVDDIAQRFAGQAASAGIALETVPRADGPQVAAVDVELLERAIANLVDNALRHCPRGSRVRLDVQREGDAVAVRVADDGPGVPPEVLPHLFERFYQGPAARAGSGGPSDGPAGETGDGEAAAPGSGLGLAIVRRIAELHGGRVGAESAPGRGTTVTLRLPVVAG